jgi:hypothetical protein
MATFTDWFADLTRRQSALKDFAEANRAKIQLGQFAWNEGRYLILHFDLINIHPIGDIKAQRREMYETVESLVLESGGRRLGGSVYFIPVLPNHNAEVSAAVFWNVLAKTTAEKLFDGDSFFLHYSSAKIDLIGGLGQTIKIGEDSLKPVVVPAIP